MAVNKLLMMMMMTMMLIQRVLWIQMHNNFENDTSD